MDNLHGESTLGSLAVFQGLDQKSKIEKKKSAIGTPERVEVLAAGKSRRR